jgi:DNA polymerase
LEKYGLPVGTISSLHGQVLLVEVGGRTFSLVPLYHPAASIYNRSLKETLQADFAVLAQFK